MISKNLKLSLLKLAAPFFSLSFAILLNSKVRLGFLELLSDRSKLNKTAGKNSKFWKLLQREDVDFQNHGGSGLWRKFSSDFSSKKLISK